MTLAAAAGIDPFWGVLATTLGGIIVALILQMRRTQQRVAEDAEIAAKSIGTQNGLGDLHQAVARIYHRQDQLFDRLDEQDARSEREWERREVGQKRMLQMQELMHSLQAMVSDIKRALTEQGQWQVTHADGDTEAVATLTKALNELKSILGDPVPGMDPLIPFVRDLKTDHGRLAQESIDTLAEARMLLEEIRQAKETT